MFGPPSLSKLLVLGAIVAIVWGIFMVIGRLQRARREEEERRVARPTRAQARAVQAQELVRCLRCGAYHAAGTAHECVRSAGRG